MDFSSMIASLQSSLGDILPKVLTAIAILVIGWLIAVIVRAVIRKALGFLELNKRISASTDSQMNLESGIATGFYYLILLMVLIAFFNQIGLELVAGPLEGMADKFFGFAPKLIGGGILILVAWVVATGVRMIVQKGLSATSLDERLTKEAGMKPMSESIGSILYWLIFLIFLPAILGAFEMRALLDPVQGMVDRILGMLPNIIGAAIIGFVGWLVAKILRDLVTNLLSAVGADSLGETAGLKGTMSLSRLVGLIVFIFIFVPVLISALNALQIEAISGPATEMLAAMMAAIPNIFAAAIILAVAFFISRFISNIVSNILGSIGFDSLPQKLGLGAAFKGENSSPSALVGKVIVFFVMLFATVEAAGQLGFSQVSEIVSIFIKFGGQVLLGVVILSIGFWLANLVRDTMVKVSGKESVSLANLARVAILALVLAMGLRAMGIADDIVNIAFTLTFGAVAVAIALSFGLGGREAAGKQMEYWLGKLRK